MAYQLVNAPGTEPVTLAEARAFLQLDSSFTSDDTLIQSVLIPAARAAAEHLTGRALITQTWRRTLDGFPCLIELEHAPLQSVSAVEYLDSAGVWQTVGADVYTVDTASEPGRVALKFGQVWPLPVVQIASVRITFVAGYGDATAVPQAFKHWMLMRIRGLWEFRSESMEVLRGKLESPAFIDGLLDRYLVAMA